MNQVKNQFQTFVNDAAEARERQKESHRLAREKLDLQYAKHREPTTEDFCQEWIEKEVWNRIQLAGIEWISEFAELLTEATGKEVSESKVREWIADDVDRFVFLL